MSQVRISDEVLERLQSLCEKRKFKPGETITIKGQRHDNMFFILSGWVEIRFFGDGGETTPLRVGERSALGEMGFLSGANAVATAVAVTFVSALELDQTTIARLRELDPDAEREFSAYLTGTIDRRLRH